jgi:hypothetical protein
MTKAENIEKRIEEINFKSTPAMRSRILSEATQAMEQTINAQVEMPSVKRIIMQSKITKFAAAAVIIIAILIGINQFGGSIDGTSVAYGMIDVPRVLKNINVVHTAGWRSSEYYPVLGEEAELEKHPTECWIDKENGRLMYTRFRWHRARPGQNAHLRKLKIVVEGQYFTEINHSTKSVSYFRLTDFWRNLLVHEKYQEHFEFALMDEEELFEFSTVALSAFGKKQVMLFRWEVWIVKK